MVTFFNRRRCGLLLLLVILPAAIACAQQPGKLDLQALTDAAKNYLPALKQKQSLLQGAKAAETDLRHSFLPQLKLSDQVNMGTDNSLAGSYLPIGINPSSSAGVRSDNDYQAITGNIGVLYGEYELVNFGLNQARLNNAKAYTGLQQADLDRDAYLVQAQVVRTYFSLLKTQYQLLADEYNVSRYDSIFRVIKAITHSGIKAGADSSQAKAELARARITLNQTLGNVQSLKEQLGYLTGIPAAQLVVDSLPDYFTGKTMPQLHFSMDTAAHPLIQYYRQQANIFKTNESVIRKTYLPRLSLAAAAWARGSGIEYNDQFKSFPNGLGYQRYNYMAGVVLTYNLFSGLLKKDKLAINRMQLEASQFQVEQEKLSLEIAERQANTQLQTYMDNLQQIPVQLQAANDTYRQKLAQYKAGIISLIDLTNASFVLYRSQTDFIETMGNWYLAQFDKAVATGNLYPFIQQIK